MENEKNMNNSILGKAMEHLRNRVDICLVIDAVKYQNIVYKPFFVLNKIFSKKWTAVCEIEVSAILAITQKIQSIMTKQTNWQLVKLKFKV